MITCYFGVPGCGKSTKLAQYYKKHRKQYDHVVTINLDLKGATRISFDDLCNYNFFNTLILIDEITLEADNREFKSFPKGARDFFVLHRHLRCDIVYATQNFQKVDSKIRDLTNELWYMSKSVVPFFSAFTVSRRIYRQININEHTSELTLGYRFCNMLESFFASNVQITYRRFYYRLFDSFALLQLESRSDYFEGK